MATLLVSTPAHQLSAGVSLCSRRRKAVARAQHFWGLGVVLVQGDATGGSCRGRTDAAWAVAGRPMRASPAGPLRASLHEGRRRASYVRRWTRSGAVAGVRSCGRLARGAFAQGPVAWAALMEATPPHLTAHAVGGFRAGYMRLTEGLHRRIYVFPDNIYRSTTGVAGFEYRNVERAHVNASDARYVLDSTNRQAQVGSLHMTSAVVV